MRLSLVPALAYLLTSIACAQSSTIRVYFATQARGTSAGIYSSTLNPDTGALSKPELAAPLPASGFLALHPTQSFLYATTKLEPVDKNNGGVAAFRIEDSGALRLLNEEDSVGRGACHVSVDASGRCLMVANYGSGGVAALPILRSGVLDKSTSAHQHEGSSAHPRRQTGPHAHSIYPGPQNRFAYAPDLGIDAVMIYRIDPARGALEPAGRAKLPPGSGPRHMKFSRDGAFAWVLNELTLTIASFARDPESGALDLRTITSTLPDDASLEGMTCSEIRVSIDGRFAYCANRDLTDAGRDSLSVFRARANGKLERIQTIGAEVWIPRNFAIDPTGRWLLVAGQRSNRVSIFEVDASTGRLTYSGRSVEIPTPMCVTFLRPLTPRERDRRGDAHLLAGRFELAIADFDHFLIAEPDAIPHHWRRGIAFYYAGKFKMGVKQFDIHRGVNPADVENAAWHFLCKAKLDGVEAARAALLPVGKDRRVPMTEIYEMFAGRLDPEDVERAAEAAQSRSALFYAHLYIGLHHESLGNDAKARHHLELAAGRHGVDGYMGEVARMHAGLLSQQRR